MKFNFETGETLLVNKPITWTSFDVVNKLRFAISHKLGRKKIKVGHAGTLDPLATGLLIICVGKHTKIIERYQGQDKEYTGTITLGATTASFDSETPIQQKFDIQQLTNQQIQNTTQQFIGEFMQEAPIYSALKSGGVAMYKKARKGLVVKPKSRLVRVHKFDLPQIDLPHVHFCIRCSKGTYIRSIAHDFGRALQNGGYLSALCRTQIGDFHLKDAWNLQELVNIIRS